MNRLMARVKNVKILINKKQSRLAANILLLFCTVVTGQAVFAAGFNAATSVTTGSGPVSVDSADLDGINGPDLVVSNYTGHTVSVFLNNGDGTYAAKVDYATGTSPSAVTIADVDGINGPDLAVSNRDGSSVSVLLNNGDGTYAAKTDYTVGAYPSSVSSGDYDGINGPDLAVTYGTPATVAVLLNNGDGTFAPKVDYTLVAGSDPQYVTSADVDGLNGPDLLVANTSGNTVSVFLNNGDGTFAAKVEYPTGAGARSITVADIDGVNGPDLAVANTWSATVSVFLNNGDGTFAAKVDYPAASNPWSISSADYDGINGPDLAVANYGVASVSVFLNNGDGTYAAKTDYSVGTNPRSVTSADVDGINGPDLVVANFSSNSVSILLNNTDTTPDAFTFTDQTDVALSTVVISNTVTLAGFNTAASIAVSNGEYSINGGAYTALAGTVSSADTVSVRHTSSASYNTVTNTVLTIGSVSDTFSSTTLTDTVPDAFSFTDQTDVPVSTLTTSSTITVSGLGASSTISVTGGEYSINGGAYTAMAAFVNDADTVSVQHTSSASYSTVTDTVLTIGGVSDTFSSTTLADPGSAATPHIFDPSLFTTGTGAFGIWSLLVLLVAPLFRRLSVMGPK